MPISSNVLQTVRPRESGAPGQYGRTQPKNWFPAFAGMYGGVVLRAVASAGLIVLLAGCSEYMQRRDAISLNAGDAVMTNRVTQMVDPWPRASANRDIAFNGERMEAAVKRYRTGRVIQPVGVATGSAYQASQQSQQPQAASDNMTPVGPTVAGAPVK